MCLSTVYELGTGKLLAKNVALVRCEDGTLLLTDILGRTTSLPATVERIDLMENEIRVCLQAAAQQKSATETERLSQ